MNEVELFLNSLLVETNAGKEGVVRTSFKFFDFANHGIDIQQIKDGASGDVGVRLRHTAKMLGFCDLHGNLTSVGRDLLSLSNVDSFGILQTQFSKWLFPRRTRRFNVDVPDDFNVYPYWCVLEFLYEFNGDISELEFILFITTTRNRASINEHINSLKFVRDNNIELTNLQNIEIPHDVFARFNSSMWGKIFEHNYFPHIVHESGRVKLSSTIDKAFIKEKIDFFYGQVNFISADSAEYIDFLQSDFEKYNHLLTYENSESYVETIDDEKVKALIKSRRGQPQFREALLNAFNGTCCVTQCNVIKVLEAAHIKPHSEETDYDPNNGLLLRSDIHTLYDQQLLSIDEEGAVNIAMELLETEYGQYQGKKLNAELFEPRKENILTRLKR